MLTMRSSASNHFDNVPVATDTIAFHITGFLVFNIGINRLAVISPHIFAIGGFTFVHGGCRFSPWRRHDRPARFSDKQHHSWTHRFRLYQGIKGMACRSGEICRWLSLSFSMAASQSLGHLSILLHSSLQSSAPPKPAQLKVPEHSMSKQAFSFCFIRSIVPSVFLSCVRQQQARLNREWPALVATKNAAPASGLFLADIVPKISYFIRDTRNKR